MSLAVSSLTSPLASVSGFCFGISHYLARIGFAETDHPNAVRRFRKAKNMQPGAQLAQCNIACLAVLSARVNCNKRILEIKFGDGFE